jgi:hypothetical protein
VEGVEVETGVVDHATAGARGRCRHGLVSCTRAVAGDAAPAPPWSRAGRACAPGLPWSRTGRAYVPTRQGRHGCARAVAGVCHTKSWAVISGGIVGCLRKRSGGMRGGCDRGRDAGRARWNHGGVDTYVSYIISSRDYYEPSFFKALYLTKVERDLPSSLNI